VPLYDTWYKGSSKAVLKDEVRITMLILWKGFYRLINPILRFLVLSFGFDSQGDQDVMRILRVRGRKSGRVYDVPVRVATLDGKPYILSMMGGSQWAHLRAVVRHS
jgi:hypothetical protein